MKLFVQRIFLIIQLLSFTSVLAQNTEAAIDVSLNITDNSGGAGTLNFGLAPDATDGIDQALGEDPLPPLPPAGVFDARWNLPGGESSLKDYKQGSRSFSGQKVYEMQYQVGTGTTITINWNLPAGLTGVLQDVLTGALINQPMNTGSGSYTVSKPDGFNKLKMTITYTADAVKPSVPILNTPSNNAAGISVTPTLIWTGSGADSYNLQLSTDTTFSAVLIDKTALKSGVYTVTASLANSTKYHWRVKGVNAAGESAWSAVSSFTTVPSTPPPTEAIDISLNITDNSGGAGTLNFGLAPDATDGIDQALGEDPLPPLPPAGVFDARWNLPGGESSLKDYKQGSRSFSGQKVYEMQYQVGTGTTITINWNLPGGLTGVLQDVLTGALINQQMNTGSGSYTVSKPDGFNKLKMTITYTADAAIPVLTSPLDNSTSQPTSVTLKWNAIQEAVAYKVQVSKNSDFGSLLINDTTAVSTSKDLTELDRETKYFWRVAAKTIEGTGPYSAVWNFTTIETIKAPTNLQASSNETGKIKLSWTDNSNNETGFFIERKRVLNFELYDSVKSNVATYTDANIGADSLYSYRICSYKNDLKSDYSNTAEAKVITNAVRALNLIPTSYGLAQNYPNPFNPSTTIRFSVPELARVKLSIFNGLGQLVKDLLDREFHPGVYEINWNAWDYSSGIYIYLMRTQRFTATRKLLLIK